MPHHCHRKGTAGSGYQCWLHVESWVYRGGVPRLLANNRQPLHKGQTSALSLDMNGGSPPAVCLKAAERESEFILSGNETGRGARRAEAAAVFRQDIAGKTEEGAGESVPGMDDQQGVRTRQPFFGWILSRYLGYPACTQKMQAGSRNLRRRGFNHCAVRYGLPQAAPGGLAYGSAENVVLPVPPGVGQMHLAIVLAGIWGLQQDLRVWRGLWLALITLLSGGLRYNCRCRYIFTCCSLFIKFARRGHYENKDIYHACDYNSLPVLDYGCSSRRV